MDSFKDSDYSSSFFSSLTPSVLFEKLNIMYLLIGLALLVIGYFVYKFYLNRKNLIGSTNIDNLEGGQSQESSEEN